jgi:16S rRNA (adenine1518-N6/adenine1519-N6)-dimethyltransferase
VILRGWPILTEASALKSSFKDASCGQSFVKENLNGLRALKSLGQHFLLNPQINQAIVLKAGDLVGVNVIEVGPGPGGLTKAILAAKPKSITALEKDWRFVDLLHPMESQHDCLTVLHADALSFDYDRIDSPKVVIANLPYNIASQLLFRWLEDLQSYRALYLMLQREVVDRICAAPGTKAYGKLSVLVQYQASARKVMDLSPESFTPPPKVDSAVVEIIPNPSSNVDFISIEKLCRIAFAHRRKMVIKALGSLFKNPASIMESVGVHHNARAEDISVAQFTSIAQLLPLNPASVSSN